MANSYRKLSEIQPAPKPASDAKVLIVQSGAECLIPLAALIDPDPAITSKADLDAMIDDCVIGCIKRFVNPQRDALEIWQLSADHSWHQIL